MTEMSVQLRPAWRNYWAGFLVAATLPPAAWGLLLALGPQNMNLALIVSGSLVFLSLLILVLCVVSRYSWKFFMNENEILTHHGIISRRQQGIRIADLRSVGLDQSIIQRLLGVGDLSFYTSGSAVAEVRFHGIKEPTQWRDQVNNLINCPQT